MRKIFLAISLLSISFTQAQTEPEKFEPYKISNGGVFGLTISPDSETALWVNSKGKRDTLIIMESHKRDGKWTKPVVASFSSQKGMWKDIDPVFTPDGKTVLFQSNRSVENYPDRQGFDIWAAKKIKNGWSEPYHLGHTINTNASESFASMAKNGNIYFMKDNENKKGNSDIWVSKYVKGEYQKPVNLGNPINTDERESNPFISPNEDYLIYFSTKPGGFGEIDFYISFNKKGKWSEPINLGKSINSELAEFCPFVHQKEKKLYFSRQKKEENGTMTEDIYSVDFDIKKYKK
ncbi:hypothetical protein NAT51_11310 [Flavobacterium amniphilum]|uniref:TolB family protein n=1 Tax=Flavobacterium amniphilum TaxID=1834035 RepID=UPI00202A3860|nr:hypothetical protein [Flavobacterium amniphilum]MCL9806116.1 hypothetical protein [Flavobacterium amniphilum]